MERSGSGLAAASEELLRLLAGAAATARLYPSASPLRLEAAARFVKQANAVTTVHGTVQYRVDRGRFVVAETAIGEDLQQVAALAETLHALQVGQLIIAPGVTGAEVAHLLEVICGDARAIRTSGGVRSALLDAGVRTIAVVEVSLRASTEAGILGLDLTASPLEEIAVELTLSATTWQQDALAGGEATDIVASAIGRLETAAQDLAMKRCAEALQLLSEHARADLLANALTMDATGSHMSAVLDIVAHMKPAALARLLRLTAAIGARHPGTLLGTLNLPPELLAEVAALLTPSSHGTTGKEVPPGEEAAAISREIADADDADTAHIERLISAATPRSVAARGLATVLTIARERPNVETVRAVSEALDGAVSRGAFDEVSQAAELLAELASDPALAPAVRAARAALISPEILSECVARIVDDPATVGARALLVAAGAHGAEALVAGYLETSESGRAHLIPVILQMAEQVSIAVGRILRTGETATALAAISMLAATSARRLLPALALALEHLDIGVREAAIGAIADVRSAESSRILQKALSHWDPQTRRLAARVIGRAGATDAVPALLRVIAEVNLFERNYELKKEVLKSLETLGSPQAIPVLERLSRRPVVIGKKNRELRYLARRVLGTLTQGEDTHRKGMLQ